jgi:hypothetical protein
VRRWRRAQSRPVVSERSWPERKSFPAAEARIAGAITTAQDRTVEAMRDMQSEILRGIEAFARGNFARMVRLETADASTTQRPAAIEENLLALETRQHPTQ